MCKLQNGSVEIFLLCLIHMIFRILNTDTQQCSQVCITPPGSLQCPRASNSYGRHLVHPSIPLSVHSILQRTQPLRLIEDACFSMSEENIKHAEHAKGNQTQNWNLPDVRGHYKPMCHLATFKCAIVNSLNVSQKLPHGWWKKHHLHIT